MAEKQTLARPYAEAVFELAQARGALKLWSEMLAFITVIAADENMQRLASDPRVDRARFRELFLGVCVNNLDDAGANFVRLLVENRRLNLLPEIVAQYETLKAEAEARVEATVTSAFTLEPEQLKTLSAALKRKLGREVNLTAQTDKALVGGIVIRAGDLVIDGSVRSRLAELATHLSH
ncbi:MAG: F0F1 ATP synthase subunit delta [Gammaproteobacteria bacterium]|nr:F0F1 ATP synthase subunit delta [Gammaproteobacteria bacterium]